jgi:hypothetical protein
VEEYSARHGPRALGSPEWEAREVATPRRRSPNAGLGSWRRGWWGGVAAGRTAEAASCASRPSQLPSSLSSMARRRASIRHHREHRRLHDLLFLRRRHPVRDLLL